MVSHRDVTIYLMAVKSFYHHLGNGEIVVIDDGTLTEHDRKILSHHLGGPLFIRMDSVDTGECPKGGTWERLLTILEMTSSHYVIQIDSDTLTRGEIPEVAECVRSNTSFTLGTWSGKDFVTLEDASRIVRNESSSHVQIAAEKALCRLNHPEKKRYVRGSSGFAGFARGVHLQDEVIEFSRGMTKLLGDRWSEWGSEQVTSNYAVANSPSAMVLPYPKYTCFYGKQQPETSSFLHFLGTHRFEGGVYGRESKFVIRSQL